MRNPIHVLKSLEEKASVSNNKYERLYRNLYNPEFYLLAFTMKKIGLGIAILLFAIIISLCSSGMGLLVIGIGIVGLIFSIIGFMERK